MSDPAVTARRDAVAELGSAVREALVAIAASEADLDTLARATGFARELSGALAGTARPLTELPSVDDVAHGIRFLSPTIGQGNPMSPPIRTVRTATGVEARVVLDRRFEGPPGFVHGGITGMLLDEVLGEAATHVDRWGMTAFLNISYHHALPLDVELLVSARVTSFEGRKTFVSGDIALADEPDRSNVTAEALFVAPRSERHHRYFDAIHYASGERADVHFGSTPGIAQS